MRSARQTDPLSSHAAAKRSSRASAQRKACLEEVLKHPGKTAAEIAIATGLEPHCSSRRLPELRGAGVLKNGLQRHCSITQHLSLTWLPATEVQA